MYIDRVSGFRLRCYVRPEDAGSTSDFLEIRLARPKMAHVGLETGAVVLLNVVGDDFGGSDEELIGEYATGDEALAEARRLVGMASDFYGRIANIVSEDENVRRLLDGQ